MTLDEASGPPVEVWPDNSDALNVFVAMATQWRSGFGGATGLDYACLPAVFDLLSITKKTRADVFNDLRVMEDAALECMREQEKSKG